MSVNKMVLQQSVERLMPSRSFEESLTKLLLVQARRNLLKYQTMDRCLQKKYQTTFEQFRAERLGPLMSYEVEQDYFDWELAINGMDEMREEGDGILANEPMSLHTSFRIGGPADLYAVATSAQELAELISLAREHNMPYLIIGRGANILVADKGIRGLVIENGGQETCFEDAGGPDVVLYAESGALLRDLARESARRGLGGLEWAVGIPGSVGGAIVGNAGAYCGYIGDVARKATVLAPNGMVLELSAAEMGFGYRTSRFKGQAGKGEQEVILSADFVLHPEPAQALAEKMADYVRRREASQPTQPSAGSVFKRTKQYPAGFLIEQAGLKGVRIGGALISPNHANFIVNLNEARAADVKTLIDLARERVQEQFGVELELEIELVGEWNG